jgi:hypothetical protein
MTICRPLNSNSETDIANIGIQIALRPAGP